MNRGRVSLRTANIIGSGPNGLAAGITLAQAGVGVTVYEARNTIGGACSTAELTLPGFHHDLGSSAFPMGIASPFFGSLPLEKYGFRWIQPDVPLAHPLDDGTAVALTPALADMASQLGEHDATAWRRLFSSSVEHWPDLVSEILGPVLHLPHHPITLARFGLPALLPAVTLARSLFHDERARALFAGCAAHSVMPLTSPLSSSVGIVLGAAGHRGGWPVVAGGSQSLSNALAAHLRSLGGEINTGQLIQTLDQLPTASVTLFDTSTEALLRIAGDQLSPDYRASLRNFRRGPGAFKIDWALSEPIPWTAEACHGAATVHVGGTLAEIAAAEQSAFSGTLSGTPFVLLVQPGVCDPGRAPAGCHTAWGYCHVPNGSTVDRTEAIEMQIERFAPGFRDCILARHTQNTAQLEAWNPNLLGGDLSGGAMTPRQLVLRPTARSYGTSDPTLFLCSSSTAPGGGVHGMCGFNAANVVLKTIGKG
jgi:phytoene dehydrogenase-like protein